MTALSAPVTADRDRRRRVRHPNGSCADRRTTASRGRPSQPRRRHHGSSTTTRQAGTVRSARSAVRPSASRDRRDERSWSDQGERDVGQVEVSSLDGVGASDFGRPRPSPDRVRLNAERPDHTLNCDEPRVDGAVAAPRGGPAPPTRARLRSDEVLAAASSCSECSTGNPGRRHWWERSSTRQHCDVVSTR